MAVTKNLIIKNKEYDSTRLFIIGSQSSNQNYYYTEASGTRYYINALGATADATIESVTTNAFLSFTSSSSATWSFDLIPMSPGNTCIIETKVLGMKSDGSGSFLMFARGGYRHSGSSLVKIGGSIDYLYKNDLSGASASFDVIGTSSVCLKINGVAGGSIDYDVHIDYTKSYHSLTFPNGGGAWLPPNIDPPN